jgi:hypothetical protein
VDRGEVEDAYAVMKATLYDLTDGRLAKLRELLRLRSKPGRLMRGIAFALRLRTHGAQIRAS